MRRMMRRIEKRIGSGTESSRGNVVVPFSESPERIYGAFKLRQQRSRKPANSLAPQQRW
jgi:hypothetical protein